MRASTIARSASGLEQNHLSPQPVAAVVGLARRHRARGGGGHVGAGALFGHEHRALLQRVEVLRRQLRQEALHQRRVAMAAQRARQRIGHRQRAAQAELGLHEQVGQRVLGGRRQRLGQPSTPPRCDIAASPYWLKATVPARHRPGA
jgi:hypothetical protein